MQSSRSIPLVLTLGMFASVCPAQGDECTNPQPISVGSYGPYSTIGATSSPTAWPCVNGGNDVWFVARTNAAGAVTFDTCGSGFDTTLEVFDGTGGCGALVSLGCNDDSCGTRSLVSLTVGSGLLLYIRVGGYNSATGSFVLNAAGPLGVATGFADAVRYGSGCYLARASFYEFFQQPATFDLSNSGFTMLPVGTGYQLLPMLAAFTPPSPNAQLLALGDDAAVAVTLTQPFPYHGGLAPSLEVCSNGIVSTGIGNSTSAIINVLNFLNAPAATWRNWHDYDPSVGGQITFEQIAGVAYFTWTNVPDWNVPSSQSTFQFQFDCNTGMVTYAFQTMSLTGSGGGGNGHLVGYSPAGASLDPGAVDLTAVIPGHQIFATDNAELQLAASPRPTLGANVTLTSTNVPAGAVGGLQVLGFTQHNPGLSLATFGMPGCSQYVSIDVVVPITPSGGIASYPGQVPASPGLAGYLLYAQSAMLVPGINTLGAISSNGVALRLDVN